MSEEARKVKIVFNSERHDVNTGEDEKTEDIYEGVMKEGLGAYHIKYDEISPDDGKVTGNLITVRGGEMKRKCMGEKSGTMDFISGSETKSKYKTPYGTFDISFHTTHMDIKESAEGIDVSLEYIMSVGGEPAADCRLNMNVRYI